MVTTFAGQHDTHIDTGEDYDTLTLASLFALKPQAKPKMAGNAFLPSSHYDGDARSHEVQRDRGAFVALVGDIDKADLPLETVRDVVERVTDGAAWLIYSSAHSRDGDRRWRVVIPLRDPIPFADWYDAQTAFFTFMERGGIPMDHAMSRAAQPVYLPNVPPAYKDGTPLRDRDGQPIYYQSEHTGTDAPGLDITRGAVSGGITLIRQRRASDDHEREVMRKAAAEKFANRPQTDGNNIIERFNESTSIATMLELCGYEQSPRSGDDWRSPQQTGETYATRLIEDKWVSLSASDAASGLGSKCKSGCFGDAYDLYVHYKHGGDHKSAYRELGREQRGHNVVEGNFRGDDGDPGWQAMPEEAAQPWVDIDKTSDAHTDDAELDAAVKALGFRITDWPLSRFLGPAPPIEWLIEGVIPRGSPGLIASLGGLGKSYKAIEIGLEIAIEVAGAPTGRKILGGPVSQHGSVVILNAEDSGPSIHRRLERLDPGEVRRRAGNGAIHIVPLPAAGGPKPLIAGGQPPIKTEFFAALMTQLDRIPDLALVIADPLQAFVAADVTSDPAAAQFMWTAFSELCARKNATFIFTHHMRKDGSAKIVTAEDAREAIRGVTTLVDGSRFSYCLWTASEEDGKAVCQQAGTSYAPRKVAYGAIVKANDEHDNSIHTYIRAPSGLLVDASEHGRKVRQTSVGLTLEQVAEALLEVHRRWLDKSPFSKSVNAGGRFLGKWLEIKYGLPKRVAKEQVDRWVSDETLLEGTCDKHKNLKGLQVETWPENALEARAKVRKCDEEESAK